MNGPPSPILDRTVLHRGHLTVERVRLRLGGEGMDREVEHHGDAAAVLPYDPARRCALLVRLPRAPVLLTTGEAASLEACAGMVDEDDPETAARREAREELGLILGALESVGRVWTSPGVATERVSLFLAPYAAADRSGAGGGGAGEHEAITVIERPLTELARAADRQEIADGKLLMLLQTLRLRRPELFGPAAPSAA